MNTSPAATIGPTVVRMMVALLAALLAACASTKIPREPVADSQPEAQALLTAAQRAHGGAAFSAIRDLNVKYAAKWSALAPGFHSELFDRRFRRESEDAFDLVTGSAVQLQKGAGGRKFVFRAPGRVSVWYNGQSDDRESVRRGSALVADAYKMFLLGPFYFQRPGVTLAKLGTETVSGAECDQIMAVLQPGFGFSGEDRVVLSIDRQTSRLRRVRTTLNGLSDGEGKELEVTFDVWAERSGVLWATEYDERINTPIGLHAQHWRLLDLKANKGFAPRQPELAGELVSEAVAPQASE